MAEQSDRTYKRRRIVDPSDENNFVDIPVMYFARMKCMSEQAQEYHFYIDNSANANRKVHIKQVDGINFERIEEWTVKNMAEQAQEYTFVMSNNDPPPIQPNGNNNPAHEKVHYVRYYQYNDAQSGCYCDVELIDELKIKCMQTEAQEWIYYLLHVETGSVINDPDVPYTVTFGFCDPSLEMAD